MTETPDQEPGIEATIEDAAAAETPRDGGGNNEAAKYRVRLRETEAERDTLKERVTSMQKREVERVAGDRLADGTDLWSVTDLDALHNDDGDLDPDKLTQAIDTLVESKPHYAARRPAPDLKQGVRGTGDEPKPASFAEIIKGERA